ncbi:chorion peroxidase-like [Penaeus indicus]|uniref:chorion peroxidase-like n=1 Tax=Penaeus indicus TaxID=29960 RepID=UPI00300D2444
MIRLRAITCKAVESRPPLSPECKGHYKTVRIIEGTSKHCFSLIIHTFIKGYTQVLKTADTADTIGDEHNTQASGNQNSSRTCQPGPFTIAFRKTDSARMNLLKRTLTTASFWVVLYIGATTTASAEGVGVLEALDFGLEQAQAMIDREQQELSDLSPQLLFAFRKAEPEATKQAKCTGRFLLEASKKLARDNQISSEDARDFLARQSVELPLEECQRRVEKLAGCDLVEPPTPSCPPGFPYRSIDGSCNNLANPKWGAAMIPFRRFLDPAYDDGIDSMRGTNRSKEQRLPSSRTVSAMLQKIEQQPKNSLITLMVMQWGQFTDHDIVHTPEAALGIMEEETKPISCCMNGVEPSTPDGARDCQPIDVSQDSIHSAFGRSCLRFVRSLIANQGCVLGPREQVNQVTAYLDGSSVYGSRSQLARDLRLRSGGQLNRTAARRSGRGHLLPVMECEGDEGGATGGDCFMAGDVRVNEQPALASMHTLWARAHNTLATQLSVVNPQWDDNMLYEETRRIIGALIQQITYRDFLPVVLGETAMTDFKLYPLSTGYTDDYEPTLDASVVNVFGTAAYRFGHTLIGDVLRGDGTDLHLEDSFFKPEQLFEDQTRPSALLEGLVNTSAQPYDTYLVPALINSLFKGPHDPVGMDLMALNIQRGRDHGLPAYPEWRKKCNLTTLDSFDDLPLFLFKSAAQTFRRLYRSTDDIDLFPAGLAEQPVPDGLLGPTFTCIIAHQFARLKRGDRFWFENPNQPKPFTEDQLNSLRSVGLASILCQNTMIENIQPNPFLSTNSPGVPSPLISGVIYEEVVQGVHDFLCSYNPQFSDMRVVL